MQSRTFFPELFFERYFGKLNQEKHQLCTENGLAVCILVYIEMTESSHRMRLPGRVCGSLRECLQVKRGTVEPVNNGHPRDRPKGVVIDR